MPEANNLINLISNIGFPIVISIYLLLRFEQKIEVLERAIQNLTKGIESSKKE